MLIDILTIFPSMFPGVVGESMLAIAQEKGLITVRLHDLRDWTDDPHRSVDDRPYGGGPGMVMKVDPIVRAVRDISSRAAAPPRVLLTSPAGRTLDQAWVRELAKCERLLIIAGHYEGYDERIRLILKPEEVSIGDYVLTGGELPAMVIVDAVARLIPGVLGDPDSAAQESFGEDGLLDHPHYTRPPEFEGLAVPEVLKSGDHGKVAEWRKAQAEKRTRERDKGR
jgi:tRNA (guanine37-N1)-methyltransferase